MDRFLQLASSSAFFVFCVVGIAVGVQALTRPTPPVRPAERPVPPPRPIYQAGGALSLPGIDLSSSERTLVLVTRKGCKFCDESMPFYRVLSADHALRSRTRIVMVSPDPEPVTRAELAAHEITVDQVLQMSLRQVKVSGTPTAIIATRSGTIEEVLIGRLDEPQQRALIQKLTNVVEARR